MKYLLLNINIKMKRIKYIFFLVFFFEIYFAVFFVGFKHCDLN